MALLKIEDLEKTYTDRNGREQRVLAVERFRMESGEQVALKGPSGCGKTTFLHLIAGIADATRGRIAVGDIEVTDLGEAARDRYPGADDWLCFSELSFDEEFQLLGECGIGNVVWREGGPELCQAVTHPGRFGRSVGLSCFAAVRRTAATGGGGSGLGESPAGWYWQTSQLAAWMKWPGMRW